MSKTNLTAGEIFDSLTGFDEMEISQQFGHNIGFLADSNGLMWARALVFIVKRREGVNDDDARNAALGMVLKDVTSFFAEESEESGKDEPEPETLPESVPTGAPEPDEVETSTSLSLA